MAVEAPDRQYQSATPLPIDARAGVSGWLAWLHPLLPSVEWIGVIEKPVPPGTGCSKHGFPIGFKAPAAAMLVARKAMVTGRVTSVRMSRGADADKVLLAIPLRTGRVLILSGADFTIEQREACIKLGRWASVWLQDTTPAAPVSPETCLNDLLAHRSPNSVAIAMVNKLKREHDCERVSLAVRHRGSTRLQLLAMSDQPRIDARKVLPCQIVAVMQEILISEQACVVIDATSESHRENVTAFRRLFEDQGRLSAMACVHAESSSVASIEGAPPLDATVIVILLERSEGRSFEEADPDRIRELVVPSCRWLTGRIREQAGLVQRLRELAGLWLNAAYLRSFTRKHMMALSSVLPIIGIMLWPVPHRISARALIEAQDLQVLVAPQAGFIASSHARAGDQVAKGELLATLDDRDLTLAVSKWQSEAVKNEQARDLALASRDRVELGRLRADAARIGAEQKLLDRQLSRAQLRAPFDGVVLSGDLSQQLGSSVVQGDTLFTVGSSDAYRLILDVDERDVGLVSAGQTARVRLAALPDRIWQATVEAVLPVASGAEDGNVFQLPARLDGSTDSVRPGMEGVAKLQVGTQSLAWVYSRRLRESLKLWMWHLGLIR